VLSRFALTWLECTLNFHSVSLRFLFPFSSKVNRFGEKVDRYVRVCDQNYSGPMKGYVAFFAAMIFRFLSGTALAKHASPDILCKGLLVFSCIEVVLIRSCLIGKNVCLLPPFVLLALVQMLEDSSPTVRILAAESITLLYDY
jgi:hypothetical protein